MTRSLRTFAAGTLAVAGFAVFPAAAAAAPASTVFELVGVETAFTSTSATFTGKGAGDAGDKAVWTTSITRTPFTPTGQSTITGGTLSMKTLSPTWTTDFVIGAVAGGNVQKISGFVGCTNETFAVNVALVGITTSTTIGGTGTFAGLLTHYRAVIFGTCRTYFASIGGQATFDY